MLANYHTHTYRCHHATGTDEEYIQKAIAEGLKILGFSDHAPYLYPNGYVAYYKMTPEESVEYFSSLSALREKYRDKIKIHIGYESEYYPELWDATFEFWKSGAHRPEYLILGQHFVSREVDEKNRVHSYGGSENTEDMREYVDALIAGIATKKFTYLAHPDLFQFFGDEKLYIEEMSRLLSAVKSADIPLEINLLGLFEGRKYPNPIFWELASEYTPKVILACDAHNPERVAVKSEIAMGLRFAEKYKLELVDELSLVDPFKE